MTTLTGPRQPMSAAGATGRPLGTARPPNRMSLTTITTEGSGLPSRVIIQGVEGVGKSSLPAYAPNPLYLMSRGETGLLTLIDKGRVPNVAHFPEIQSWDDLLGAIESVTSEPHEYKTLVIDTLNGCERLCHEHVCRRDFHDDWTDRGFLGYMRGYEVSLADWRNLLIALDRLRETRHMAIMALCHTKVAPYKNPEGPDYDRFTPDFHAKTWSLTHKWADAVLFANFYTVVNDKKKASGGNARVMYTERTAAYDAKNRHGLPPEIEMGNSGAEAWENFVKAMQAGKEGAK